jgi:hypothetical protein
MPAGQDEPNGAGIWAFEITNRQPQFPNHGPIFRPGWQKAAMALALDQRFETDVEWERRGGNRSPLFHYQSRHTAKLAGIASDHAGSQREGVTRQKGVVCSNRLGVGLERCQVGANATGVCCGICIERRHVR